MLIPISISSEDILSQFDISKSEVEDVIDFTVKEIAAAFYVQWQEEANTQLKSTRSRYVNNLRLVDSGRMEGAIVLDYQKDPLIRMIEEGASAFDMKEGFEKSTKRHEKKDGGWFLTIPFKVGTPGSSVVSGFANILPASIHKIVKAKEVSPVTGRTSGLTKSEIPEAYAIPKVRAAIAIPKSQAFEEYQHKGSIYGGVFKSTDAVTGQSSYGSFRRVSDKSDENSWIFPGMEPKNLADSAFNKFEGKMQTVLEDSMNSALSYFGFE